MLDLDRRSIDIAGIVALVVSDLRPEAEAAGLTIHGALEPAAVLADPVRVRQMALNLIGNAIRHGIDGRAVDVSVRIEGSEVVFEVADTGEGFPEGDRQHLFVPFWCGAQTRANARLGSGLVAASALR